MTLRDLFPTLHTLSAIFWSLLDLLEKDGTAPARANLLLFTEGFRQGSSELQRLLQFFVDVFHCIAAGALPQESQMFDGLMGLAFFRGDHAERPTWNRRHIYIVLDRTRAPQHVSHLSDPAEQDWFKFQMGGSEPIELTPNQVLVVFWIQDSTET